MSSFSTVSMIGECGVSVDCKIAGVFKQCSAFYKHSSFIMNLVNIICNWTPYFLSLPPPFYFILFFCIIGTGFIFSVNHKK
jgi:hypothetical protein